MIVCPKHGLQQNDHQKVCKVMKGEKDRNRVTEIISIIMSHRKRQE
jgi:hypothetical protein